MVSLNLAIIISLSIKFNFTFAGGVKSIILFYCRLIQFKESKSDRFYLETNAALVIFFYIAIKSLFYVIIIRACATKTWWIFHSCAKSLCCNFDCAKILNIELTATFSVACYILVVRFRNYSESGFTKRVRSIASHQHA